MPRTVPTLPGIEAGGLPFSQVVEANGFVFLAGQVGNAPGEPGAVPGGIEAETRQMLDNVGRLLGAVGLGYGDVVKATVYLRDFGEFETMNRVYREYFPIRAADAGHGRRDRARPRLPGRDRGGRRPLTGRLLGDHQLVDRHRAVAGRADHLDLQRMRTGRRPRHAVERGAGVEAPSASG